MPFFLTSKFGSGAYGVNAIRDARNKPGVKKASRMFARLTYLFDQNLLLRKKTRPLFAFIAFLIFGFELGVGLNCQAGTPFDDYTIGNINGQDSWSETSPTGYINVVGNPVNSGSQAVESSVTAPGENILSRSVTDSTTGSFSIYIRHDGGRDYLNFKDDGNYAIYTKYESTSFSFYNGSWNVACTGLTNNQYWNIQIEWRSSDHKARYKCGIAAWTDWIK